MDKVSIPRSEFWSFGRRYPGDVPGAASEFQFLGRNSGRSDSCAPWRSARNLSRFQFLGRNSGRSDMHPRATVWGEYEFQFLGRNSGRSDSHNRPRARAAPQSFNSSVGILVVRTQDLRSFRCDPLAFQFLGRNSGRSDVHLLSLDNI